MAVHGFNRHLNWSDYQVVDHSLQEPYNAYTETSIQTDVKYATKADGTWHVTKVNVTVQFVAEKSWVVKGEKSQALLKHEQGHYDIAAIAAHTVETKLRHLKGNRTTNPSDEIKRLSKEIIGESAPDGTQISEGKVDQVQKMYDEDLVCGSKHGADPNQQAIWEHRIHKAHFRAQGTISDLASCPHPRENAATPAAGE